MEGKLGGPLSEHTRNLIWFEFAALVLKINPQPNEDILETAFPFEARSEKFEQMKGYFLASYQLSRQVFNEDPDIVVFELDEVVTSKIALDIQGLVEPLVSKRAEANIGSLQVRPLLSPTAPKNKQEAKSTTNLFKATVGRAHDRLIVVILPFSVPDNLCHFAAQEATMCFD